MREVHAFTFSARNKPASLEQALRDFDRHPPGPVGSRSELTAAALMVLGYPCVMLAALVPDICVLRGAAAVTYAPTGFCTSAAAT